MKPSTHTVGELDSSSTILANRQNTVCHSGVYLIRVCSTCITVYLTWESQTGPQRILRLENGQVHQILSERRH